MGIPEKLGGKPGLYPCMQESASHTPWSQWSPWREHILSLWLHGNEAFSSPRPSLACCQRRPNGESGHSLPSSNNEIISTPSTHTHIDKPSVKGEHSGVRTPAPTQQCEGPLPNHTVNGGSIWKLQFHATGSNEAGALFTPDWFQRGLRQKI